MMESTVMTPQEVSEYLRVGVRTVYEWIKVGELPAIRLGKTYRIEQTDLERFLRRHKTVKRPLSWQRRFDSAMDKSQRAFREYLIDQGYDPDTLTDEDAESILNA
jgi:excisionase family DNA binding protein